MSIKSLSHCQGKGCLNHNNRVFNYRNVDPKRTPNNVIYKKQSLEEAYEHCFGESVKRYNAKTKRKDRHIDNYYEYLFGKTSHTSVATNSNGKKSYYETLVQIGTMDDSGIGTPDSTLVTECLEEYMIGFQERNPNLYVFNAVTHMDEKTPHLHIDYIPIGHYKTGMDTQNGMAQALKEMGYGNGKDAINKWRLAERKVLEDICNQRGIEISEPKKSRGTFTPEAYKEACRDAENRIDTMTKEQDILQLENDNLTKKNEYLSKSNKNLYEQNKSMKDEVANAVKTISDAKKSKDEIKYLEAKKNGLEDEIIALEDTLEPLIGRKLKKEELDKIKPKAGMLGSIKGVTVTDINNLKTTALSVLERDEEYEMSLKKREQQIEAEKAAIMAQKQKAIEFKLQADKKLEDAKSKLEQAEKLKVGYFELDKLRKENKENKELLQRYAPSIYATKYGRNRQVSAPNSTINNQKSTDFQMS